MQKLLAAVLWGCLLYPLIPTVAHSGEIPNSAETLLANPSDITLITSDARYAAIARFIKEFDYSLQGTNIRIHAQSAKGEVFFVPVVDKQQASRGFVLVNNEKWTLNLQLSYGTTASYAVNLKPDRTVDLIQKKVNQKFQPSSFFPQSEEGVGGNFTPIDYRLGQAPQHGNVADWALQLASYYIQGYDYCMYTSKVGLNFGCWVPDDNPFGYYFVTTYRKGTPITPQSQAWYADWKGRTVICPRTVTQTLTFVQCGFPPN